MSGDVSFRKRLVSITAPNLRNNHVYLSGHHDFSPVECYGGSSKKKGIGRQLSLLIESLPEPIQTDISTRSGNGRPRSFFRKRAWVRKFFEKQRISPSDTIRIERICSHRFRVTPFEAKGQRDCPTTLISGTESVTVVPTLTR